METISLTTGHQYIYGWQSPGIGQCLHREVLEVPEIRLNLSSSRQLWFKTLWCNSKPYRLLPSKNASYN
jgi:hypothetical protein